MDQRGEYCTSYSVHQAARPRSHMSPSGLVASPSPAANSSSSPRLSHVPTLPPAPGAASPLPAVRVTQNQNQGEPWLCPPAPDTGSPNPCRGRAHAMPQSMHSRPQQLMWRPILLRPLLSSGGSEEKCYFSSQNHSDKKKKKKTPFGYVMELRATSA